MRFVNIFRGLREQRGWTTQQLADRVGMEQGNLSKIENGRTWIGEQKLFALADALGVSVADLFRTDEESGPDSNKTSQVSEVGLKRLPVWDYAAAPLFVYSSPKSWNEKSVRGGQKYLLTDQDYPKDTFGLVVSDDAMSPALVKGSVGIVMRNKEPKPGSVIAIAYRDAARDLVAFRTFYDRGIDKQGKRVFDAVPSNPAFQTMRSDDVSVVLLGVLVEERRYRE